MAPVGDETNLMTSRLGTTRPFLALLTWAVAVSALGENGKFHLEFNNTSTIHGIVKNVYNNTKITFKLECESTLPNQQIRIGWVLRETQVTSSTLQRHS